VINLTTRNDYKSQRAALSLRARVTMTAAVTVVLTTLLGTTALVGGVVFANAEPTAKWLMRLNEAAQDINYRGKFIYRHGDQIEAMQIVRKVDEEGARERLVSLNGATREIIRDKRDVWCYLPDENRGVHQSRKDEPETKFPALLPQSLVELEGFYRFELGAVDRVAGRPAQRVDIYPKDSYRYGLMLWIDKQTGLMLRADMLSDQGSMVEQYMFVEIEYDDDISMEELSPSTPRENLVWHGDESLTLKIPDSSSDAASPPRCRIRLCTTWSTRTGWPLFQCSLIPQRPAPKTEFSVTVEWAPSMHTGPRSTTTRLPLLARCPPPP